MKVLVCGSRTWSDAGIIWNILEILADHHPDAEVIHGAARGADTIAGHAALALGFTVHSVPANWEQYGKAAGPMRNKQMLDMAPDHVLAFRLDGKSSGTDHMIKIAHRAGVPVRVVDQRGQFRDLNRGAP